MPILIGFGEACLGDRLGMLSKSRLSLEQLLDSWSVDHSETAKTDLLEMIR